MRQSTRTLTMLKQEARLVDLYRDRLQNESLTGIVTDFTDHFVYLSLFDDGGGANGISVVWRSDVTRIRWGGNERDSIATLVKASGAQPVAPKLQLDTVETMLRSVRAAFGYVNVMTERMDSGITFIGEIEELDAETLVLQTYGTFLSRDRSHLMLDIDEITRVDADARYERSVHYLATMQG
jgi:hypothetical protein